MSGAMNRHCIPGLTMSTALTGNFSAGCPGIIKTMHTSLSAFLILRYANAPVLTRKKPDVYDLAWKDLCSVLNALSK